MTEINDTKVQEINNNSNNLNINFILSKIVQIMDDTKYIKDVIESLSGIPNTSIPGDIGIQGKSMALSNVVEAREQTNRQLLTLFEKMYDDLREKQSIKQRAFGLIEKLCNEESLTEDFIDKLDAVLDTIRHLDN